MSVGGDIGADTTTCFNKITRQRQVAMSETAEAHSSGAPESGHEPMGQAIAVCVLQSLECGLWHCVADKVS